jgi:hypothetical protein
LPRLPPLAASFKPQRCNSESGPERPRMYGPISAAMECLSKIDIHFPEVA